LIAWSIRLTGENSKIRDNSIAAEKKLAKVKRERSSPALGGPDARILWIVGGVALVLKLLLALLTYGTNDVYAFERFAVWSGYLGAGLYRAAPDFNHPPSMIHILGLLNWLGHVTGLGFAFFIRLPAVLADAVSLWLMWRLFGARAEERSIWLALVLYAGAPALILVSGFHGNTDSVMICFLLLTIYLLESGSSSALAGAAFGLALCIKAVPVLTLPVMVFYLTTMRQRIIFLLAAGAVVLAGWSPYVFQDPRTIVKQVLGYKSLYGHWGLSYLANQFIRITGHGQWLTPVLSSFGAYILIGAIVVMSVWMNRTGQRPRLFSQVGIVFFTFLSFSSGFAVQYLAWAVPWMGDLGVIPAAFFYASSGVFLFLVYNYWSHGIPWYLADSNRVGDFLGHGDYFQLLCWSSVVFALWVAWRKMRTGRSFPGSFSLRADRPAWQVAAELLAWASLAFALVVLISDQRQGAIEKAERPPVPIQSIRAESYLDLAKRLFDSGRYQDSVKVGADAVSIDPSSAETYNLMGAAYGRLQLWDESIGAARAAVRLRPEWAVARENLAWAVQQRQKQRTPK
jgi:hypothetical protein